MRVFLLFLLLVISSCASSNPPLGSGISLIGEPVCLTDCKEIPFVIEKYLKNHDLNTEEDEIDYLLFRIRSSRNKFIRNGSEADSTAAAQFLRWKLGWYPNRHEDRIVTDEDFIDKILKGSEKSGQPYEVVLPNGTKHNLQYVMMNELNYMEISEGEKPEYPGSTFLLKDSRVRHQQSVPHS